MNCLYFPADPECAKEAVNYFRNRRGKARPLCRECDPSTYDQRQREVLPLTEDVVNELICQEIMES